MEMTVTTKVTHKYLMGKSKSDLAYWILRLLDERELDRAAELQRAPVQTEQTCPSCGGHGRLKGEFRAYECPNCKGTGKSTRSVGG